MADASAYAENIKKYAKGYNKAAAEKIVGHLGIALRNKDSSVVACSDGGELDRIRDRWCRNKLGLALNQGELDGQRLLGRKTVELMLLNHLPEDGRWSREPFSGYGLGGSVMRDVALSQMLGSIGEWGWSGAAHTWFWIDPLENTTGIIMTQFLPPFFLRVTQDFKNMVYQALVD